MKFKKLLLLSLVLAVPVCGNAIANSIQYISQRQAQGLANNLPEIFLHKGYGDTIIDFRELDEVVRQVNIGDSSQMAINSDDPECLSQAASGVSRACEARIIYLKQMKPIVFDGLYTSPWTELKAITDINIYVFKVKYSPHPPKNTVYKLKADKVVNPTKNSLLDNYLVLRRGYILAREKEYIGIELEQRIEKFLQIVYEGVSIKEAARQQGISQEAVEKLELLGKLNDGSLE